MVADPATKRCALVDPVLDFDEKSGTTGTMSADAILSYVDAKELTVQWILDTHPHADHLSAAHYLQRRTAAPTAIGARVVDMQRLWKGIYNCKSLATDGSQWDRLFAHGETFVVGSIPARVLRSPGHTPASITYLIGDAAFVNDTLFMPDGGTARADFPGGNAETLWASIQAILALPPETRVFTGHDYRPGGREPRWESTVGEQMHLNIHLAGVDAAAFVKRRETRDRTLPMPKLMLHALQVNLLGGRLPEPETTARDSSKSHSMLSTGRCGVERKWRRLANGHHHACAPRRPCGGACIGRCTMRKACGTASISSAVAGTRHAPPKGRGASIPWPFLQP